MKQQPSLASSIEQSVMHNMPERRLHGRGLLLARVGWIAVTVTLVILNLMALSDTWHLLTNDGECAGRDAHEPALQ